ncbi:MAG TPA: glycine--tRNA ligase subunit beta [Oscillatoriaceae cyanobacterium M33_DOE_052]|uniref:Glycine--tRNA ligase beta subunit n=1 Tax=Planktothricoides sp. SpSt-374 TaxID=2282167 RepID=A0A7C3ZW06_9CYAN|nr:glycine--tRNA ligase subunit beta [Oscillatoriaceae cyanobacterium M33_DOE_052]
MPNFLLELGTEELPADFVASAIAQWQSRIPTTIAENLLTNDAIRVFGTPRRLAVLIEGLPHQQPDREEEIKGPPAAAAFKNGQPTPAAIGFAKKQEVELDALEIRPTDKGDFVFVLKKIQGRATSDILAALVPQWINSLEGKRLMRWGDGDVKFSRPLRNLTVVLDNQVLPVVIENNSQHIESGRVCAGHRVLHPEPVTINNATDYIQSLQDAFIEVDPQQRQTTILQQIQTVAAKVGGVPHIPPDLLQEVTNLVEWPTAVIGKFDPEFLILPPEVITTVMVKHQRYFPVLKPNTTKIELLPYFITISNGDPAKSDIIAAGNERVLRARLADGQFFYKTDTAKTLETYVTQLEKVTFQEDLGSVRDKVARISQIAGLISEQLKLNPAEREAVQRAALLCKADLVTQMVYEFPELQGVMGEKYARIAGESEAVATAIFEHYLPRNAADILPQTMTGQVIALADKLDTIVSIFGLGMLPTGSSDPFALRRAANAVINITWAADLSVNLHQLLTQTVRGERQELIFNQVADFFGQRLRALLLEERLIDYDLVNAVLGENDPEYAKRALADLLDLRDRATFLQSIRENGNLDTIYETVNRSTRLAKQGDLDTQQLDPAAVVEPALFQKSCEQGFYDALVQLVPTTKIARDTRNYQQLVDSLAAIAPVVSNFFDGPESVLVMDADPKVQRNRLNLLGLLRNHARVLADFGPIVKS